MARILQALRFGQRPPHGGPGQPPVVGDFDLSAARLRLRRRNDGSSNPVGLTPLLIFDEPAVSWSDLAPFAAEALPSLKRREIVATFPTPGAMEGSDLSDVVATVDGIKFPGVGAYNLYTTVGTFKVLLIDRADSHTGKILSVARFLAANCVHSRADTQLIQPLYNGPPIVQQNLLYPLFATDQPLKLHCGDVADFTGWVLAQIGYRTRVVFIRSEQRRGHAVTEVVDPDSGREFMVDCNKGFVVAERETGDLLSVAAIARRFRESPDSLQFVGLGGNGWLKPQYNNPIYQGPFTWTPDKSQPQQGDQWYRDILLLKSHSVEHLPWGAGRLGSGTELKWNGQRL